MNANTVLQPDPSAAPASPDRGAPGPHGYCPDTNSGLVSAASRGEMDARNEMARVYRGPVLGWFHSCGCRPEQAEDFTQEFLAAMLAEETGFLRKFRPQKGRLRSYLRVAVTRHVIKERRRSQAAKRGGGAVHLSLDLLSEMEAGLMIDAETEHCALDTAWALSLHQSVKAAMERTWCADPAREPLYRALEACLTGFSTGSPPWGDLSNRLGRSEATLRRDVTRWNAEYAALWTAEVRRTVSDPADVAGESTALLGLLRKHLTSRDARTAVPSTDRGPE